MLPQRFCVQVRGGSFGMSWLKSIRFERGGLAVGVVAAHLLLVYLVIEARFRKTDRDPVAPPVIAMLLEEPRTVPLGSQPVEVQTQTIPMTDALAPKTPDLPDDPP